MSTTLADHLRALPDDGLAALIKLRPDLVVPVPADFSALAIRAQSRLSVARALDGLDRFTLEVLDALRFTRTPEETSVEAVLALTAQGGVDPARVRAAIDRLRALLVVYGPEFALRVVAGADEVCSPHPAGLGRTAAELDAAAAALASDAAQLRRTLLAAPPAARAVLDRLAAGPPLGSISPTALSGRASGAEGNSGRASGAGSNSGRASGAEGNSGRASGAGDTGEDTPVRWLVNRHLLVPVSDDTVELPREVALLLRRDAGPLGPLHPLPPAVQAPAADVDMADRAGAGQAREAVRHIEALLDALDAEPAPVLRAGGLGVRELRRLAKAAVVDEPAAGLLLEVAFAAGLLGESSTESGDSVLLPTLSYDGWRAASIAQRWSRLASAWLNMPRAPALIGQRDDRDRPVAALSAEVARSGAPHQRRAILAALAELPPGAAPSAGDLREILAWQAPRRAGRAAGTTGPDEVLAESATLGVTGLGALTGYARTLVDLGPVTDDDDPLGIRSTVDSASAVAALDALLPPPVDHLLVQADLTVVVPGPPEPGLAAELAAVADVESAGGASVFRVSADSIRRALDAGYAATDLHALFGRRSRTKVPQALSYLIDDVARRHGGLRVGSVGSYLRSDDEALISEVLADRRLAVLSLRRLAPTVLATPYAGARLLGALREAGYAPVPEDATGAAVLTRPKTRRAPARPALTGRREDPLAMPPLRGPRLAGIVEQIRRGDAATRAARRAPVTVRAANGSGTQEHLQAIAVLQQALRERSRVWVGYVDAHGSAASRLVRPISMGGGYLRAEDERNEMMHTFALHRITAAVMEDSSPLE